MKDNKDYLKEYALNLAKSFCEFKTLTNMKVIQYAIWDSNFENVFRSIFDIVMGSDITTGFYRETAEMKEVYQDWLRIDFRKVVRESIEQNDNKYMISRFLLIRTLDPGNSYKLFDGEEWYEKCLSIERRVFSEIFNLKKEDDESIIRQILFLWAGNDLTDREENELESKFLEYVSKF